MKVFCVSKDCNACGECILSTDLLSETADGFAIPTAGKYIEDNNLDQASKTGYCFRSNIFNSGF